MSLRPSEQNANAVASAPGQAGRTRLLIVASDASCRVWLARIVEGYDRLAHSVEPNSLNNLPDDAAKCRLVIAACRTLHEGTRILAASRFWVPSAPVLTLSADPSTDAAVSLLRAGADSALAMSSPPSLIRASVEATIRRNDRALDTSYEIRLDQDASIVVVGGRAVVLRRASFRLCEYLLRNKERWVSERELRERALGASSFSSDSLVRVHVRHLRMALGEYGPCLQSRRFAGYRLVVPATLRNNAGSR